MKLRTLFLPAVALTAATFLLPSDSEGFVLLGGSLGLSQRDFRVFDNFGDAEANANTTAHPMFPGYTGAEMACWKGAIEWGSRPHGNGTGDSTQTNLGDGGANFDPSWQGNASGTGGLNDNTMSEINATDNSVLAYMEGGVSINDGWRIRFIATPWVWNDGPGSIPGSHIDIQGILTHEYGHALGLDHTGVGNATMGATASGNGVADRSIAPDDIAGVQAVYGVASASKPVITGINKCGMQLELLGTNFSSSGNEVWFTQAATGGSGVPVKLTSVTSTMGGQLIQVTIPVAAGSGDVLVRNNGTGNANLSNAWPLDVTVDQGQCGPIIPEFEYLCFGDGGNFGCTPCPCGNNAPSGSAGGCVNSSGVWAILVASGVQSVSADTLSFSVFGANPSTFAALVSADNQLPTLGACPPGTGVQSAALDGLRCIGGALFRHGTRAMNTAGTNSAPWGPPGGPSGGLIAQGGFVPGQTRQFQVFYREFADMVCMTGQNTSNSVGVTFVP